MKKKVIIVGAGLTGLSTGYHLKKLNQQYFIYEKGNKTGGLCSSIKINNFIFDYTGHFLHLKDNYVRKLVFSLLKNNVLEIKRASTVYISNQYINYPFQTNFYQLNNKKIIKECETGLKDIKRKGKYKNFKDWLYEGYGSGITKYFMAPYNEKMWKFPLNKILPEGTIFYIPDTKVKKPEYGYNITFNYPSKGGMGVLADSFAEKLKNIYLCAEVTKIDINKKLIKAKGKDVADYDYLIPTIPLPELINMLNNVPMKVKQAADSLKYVSLFAVNLGISRANVSKYHWIYFPEKKFIFHRVGFYSNISADLVPEGTSSLYTEISYMPHMKISGETLVTKVKTHLLKTDILNKSDKILVEKLMDIKYAYVIFDLNYHKNMKVIMEFLKGKNIYPAGRYGRWVYSAMEDAILDGKLIAERLADEKI